jgi:RHS repeat-associated protein
MKNASGGVTTYNYGSCGELRGVGLADGTDISYEIDPLNRRIGKSVNGNPVQQFIYKDALNPVAELDGDGTITAVFIYGAKANVPELMVKNGTTYRLITDPNGSVRQVVSTTDSSVVQRIDYDAFGRVLSDSNPGFQPFGFQGGLYDLLTGLVRFGARDYDPATGRWLSKDPIGISGGMNLYVFCDNNPVSYIDPSGLCKEDAWNPSGHAVVWKGGKIGFFAVAGVELGSITLKFDNGYLQNYKYISSGVGVGFSLAFDLGGDVYGVYSPSDYTGSFWNTDVSVGYSYGTSWWGDTANDSHSMGSVGATATYQGYWTSGGPYK